MKFLLVETGCGSGGNAICCGGNGVRERWKWVPLAVEMQLSSGGNGIIKRSDAYLIIFFLLCIMFYCPDWKKPGLWFTSITGISISVFRLPRRSAPGSEG